MSDYLARLAERLTAAEPAFVPRVPSRFEPDSPQAGGFFETSEELDGETARPAAPAFFDPPPARPAPAASAAWQAADQRPSPGGAPVREVLESRGAPVPAGANPAARIIPVLIEPQRADFQPPALALGHAVPVIRRSGGEGLLPAAIAADARHPGSGVIAAARAAVAAGISRPVENGAKPGAPPAAGEAPASETGTLEISIGRIEIRPPAAPPGASKPARRTPRLTLEKYIEQRRGGLR